MEESEKYYDEFGTKLLVDFAYGNPRVLSAIEFTLKNISESHTNILDIGCGIGWTSFEVARNFPETKIDAIDLSQNSILIANELFKRQNINYQHLDVTSSDFNRLTYKYDLIILIDVFEHIAKKDRQFFVQNIVQKLEKNGMILLTFPSPEHQRWITEHTPSKLQPVDEIIELIDLIEIAKSLNGKVSLFQYKDIWHSNDYNYALIKLGLQFSGKISSRRKIRVLNQRQRKKLLLNSNYAKTINWTLVNDLIKNDHPKFKIVKRSLKYIMKVFSK